MTDVTRSQSAATEYPGIQVAAALLRRGDAIVLVQERRGQTAFWSVPGGGVEVGELVTEALARETREEAGVLLRRPGRLAYIVNSTTAAFPSSVAFFFECEDWEGQVAPADPDGDIVRAALFSRKHAIALLEASPATRPETEPLLAYLHDSSCLPVVWSYRDDLPVASTTTGKA